MKRYVGIDLGKKTLKAVALTDAEKPDWFKGTTHAEQLDKLRQWVRPGDLVALEAGNLAFRLAKFLRQKENINVIVLNPGELATIYASLKKTDKEDALKIARLVQRIPVTELPTVTIPSDLEMERRALATESELYLKSRTKLINRFHALLHNGGVSDVSRTDLQNQSKRDTLALKLPVACQSEAKRLCKTLEQLEKSTEEIDNEMRKHLHAEKSYTQLAMSVPGIGEKATFTLLAFVGDGKRFKHAGQVSYYAGMTPTVNISGQKSHYGRIAKRGCRQIKRVITQCAWGLIGSTHGGPIKTFYDRVMPRIGKKKAAVAVGRKILEVFFTMLRTGELYRGIPEKYYRAKLVRYGLI